MKILLTGAKGQLGSCFLDRAHAFDVYATDREELDISDRSAILNFVNANHVDLIVNAAAYTAVDKAENEVKLCKKVNADGPENLAKVASEMNIPIIHISTDYVFDGRGTKPYLPDDQINPLGVYGKTKWEGEESVRKATRKHIIIRTAWVFSEYGANFVKTMLRVGAQRDELGVVADQKGCPTYAGHLADAILDLIPKCFKNDFSLWGTHHFCGSEETTWHGFAQEIFTQALEYKLIDRKPTVNAIKTEEYPTPAARPAYSVMDCSSLSSLSVTNNWVIGLGQVLSKLK